MSFDYFIFFKLIFDKGIMQISEQKSFLFSYFTMLDFPEIKHVRLYQKYVWKFDRRLEAVALLNCTVFESQFDILIECFVEISF